MAYQTNPSRAILQIDTGSVGGEYKSERRRWWRFIYKRPRCEVNGLAFVQLSPFIVCAPGHWFIGSSRTYIFSQSPFGKGRKRGKPIQRGRTHWLSEAARCAFPFQQRRRTHIHTSKARASIKSMCHRGVFIDSVDGIEYCGSLCDLWNARSLSIQIMLALIDIYDALVCTWKIESLCNRLDSNVQRVA
jgi:hypothetical protein